MKHQVSAEEAENGKRELVEILNFAAKRKERILKREMQASAQRVISKLKYQKMLEDAEKREREEFSISATKRMKQKKLAT